MTVGPMQILVIGFPEGGLHGAIAPVLADLREREPAMKKLKMQAERYQARQTSAASSDSDGGQFAHEGESIQDTVPVSAGSGTSASGRTLHPYVQTGPRNQPKRPPKSKR